MRLIRKKEVRPNNEMINVKGIPKTALFMALFDAANKWHNHKLSPESAEYRLGIDTRVDDFDDACIYIEFQGDAIDPKLYDRYNTTKAAEVIAKLRTELGIPEPDREQ